MALVSVVVPSYNRISLLPKTVASVQAQTHEHWELLIVDDGSTDGTRHWVRSQTQQDCRVQLIVREQLRPDTGGAQVCRNVGLAQSSGDAVVFLDSDDLLAPDCLSRRSALLMSDQSIAAVIGQAGYFKEQAGDLGLEQIWAPWNPDDDDLNRFLTHDIPWQTTGPLWRRSALQTIGPWDEQLQRVGHDHEFHVRALCRGLRLQKLPGIDYFWRVPRYDSLSSFEAFKQQHREGGMIAAYQAVLADVISAHQDSLQRRRLMASEVIKLALQCRNLGGSPAVSEQGILHATECRVLQLWASLLCRLLLRCWWCVANRNLAMAVLSRLSRLGVIAA